MLPNGGFPPIVISKKNKDIKITKERGFAPTNINIQQILNTSNKKLIVDNNKEEIDIV